VLHTYSLNLVKKFIKRGLAELYGKIEGQLKEEVARHKYFMSEKRKYDVGTLLAEGDYIKKHLTDFVEGAVTVHILLLERCSQEVAVA